MKSKSKRGRIGLWLEAASSRLRLASLWQASLFSFLFSLLSSFSSLAADSDWGFYYQAEIRDANGNVIVDSSGNIVHNHTITIKLYPGASSSDVRWGRTYNVCCDNNGLFSVFLADVKGDTKLGPTDSLKTVIQNHSPSALYIGLTIGDNTEIKPRQQICAMPYANVTHSLAPNATAISNLTVAGDCTVSNAVRATSFYVNGVSPVSVPVGAIILWSRSDIAPDGQPWNGSVSQDATWAICDGSGCKPNLQQRFLVGVGKLDGTGTTYSHGDSYGAEKVALALENIPKHSHEVKFDLSWMYIVLDMGSDIQLHTATLIQQSFKEYTTNVTDVISFEIDTGSTGSSSAHENRPPYCALYYVKRVQ